MLMSRNHVDFTISLRILLGAMVVASQLGACSSQFCSAMSKLFVAVATAAASPASGNAVAMDTQMGGARTFSATHFLPPSRQLCHTQN